MTLQVSEGGGGVRVVLQVRPLRRYLLGQTLSGFGDSLMPIALVFAVLGQGGGAAAVGVVLLASRIPSILIALLSGALGDRADRRTVMLCTDAARCLLQATTAALLLTGHCPLWALVVLQGLAGTASALFTPAAAGLVRTLAPPMLLAQANALLGLTRNTVALAGLAIAGALVATVGPGWAFALDAATFATSAVFLTLLARLPSPARPGQALWRAALLGVQEVGRRRWLWTSIVYVAALNLLAICPFLVLGPVIAQQELGGAVEWSAIAFGYAAGSIGGSTLVLRWHPAHPLRAAFLGALALTPFLYLLGAAAPVPVLIVTATLAGTQAAVFNVLHNTTLQTHVPEHLVSRVASVNMLGSLAAVPLGLGLAGPLAQATSPRTVLTAAAVLAILGTITVLCIRDVRDLAEPASAPDRAPAPIKGRAEQIESQ
jgi:MFS family permease